MFRIMGIILIVGGSSCLGFSFCEEYEKRMLTLRMIRRMMEYIKERIEVECDTLQEAFFHTANRMEGPFRELLQMVYKELENKQGKTIETIWKECCGQINFEMKPKDFVELSNAMGQTGFIQKEQQNAWFRQYIQSLDEKIEKLKKEKKDQCRLYQAFGVMSGLLFVIMLW